MATKNALKDVARVEDLPLDKSNALCKAIPDRLPDGMKMNLANAIKCTPELQMAEASADPKEAQTIKFARMLEGQIRGTGIHACGFIICRDPISDHVPVSTADDPDFPGMKTTVTQFDGHVIESTGLIKMDFLGLKTLSEMKEACRVIKESEGIEVDLDNIPIDDELTYKLYQEGRTVGTFQFESVGMQKYLKELHPTVFEDLIAMNALYRPGPMDKIPSFIARKNGREEIAYEIPCMEKYLKDTYGITVYQEQVMLLSRQLANFTRGESDALRKAMGKKKKDIVDKMKPKFIEGGVKNGHDPKVLEDIWSAWEKFASYAFNKSHAACYSWVAYQTAYLKAHYPQEFMAALLTQRKDDIKEVTKLLDECRAMNIEVLGPDVNESHTDFGVNSKKQIRFGLMAIKGLGASAAEAIVNERKDHGPYKNIFDFVQRVPISAIKRNGLECLALSGAFDTFSDEIQREQFMAISNKGELFIDTLTRYSNQFQQAQQNAQFSLFGMDAIEVNTPQIPQAEKWSTLERLNREKELVGIYLSAHPLDEYSVVLKGMCNLHMDTMADLTPFVDQNVTLGGIVTDVRNGISNKSNKPYGIVTMEDYSGSGEIRLFAEEWVKWANYMSPGNTLYMTGRVHLPWTTSTKPSLKIESIDFLSNVKDRLINSITINVVLPELDEDAVMTLINLANEHPGNVKVSFKFFDGTGRNQIGMQSRGKRISVNRALLDYIEGNNALSYRIN